MKRHRQQASFAEVLNFVVMFIALSLANPLGVLFWMIVAAACVVALFAMSNRRYLPDISCPCVYCGYDLRHTRSRCPECGKLIPPGAAHGVGPR